MLDMGRNKRPQSVPREFPNGMIEPHGFFALATADDFEVRKSTPISPMASIACDTHPIVGIFSCPECGNRMVRTGICFTCLSCGWSACG